MGKKRRAFHGEPHAAGNAGKQLAAKRLLQPVDGAGYGGLGQAQQLGGLCDIAGLCHRIKGAVIFQIEGFHGQLPCERKENMLTRDHTLLFHLLLGIALFVYMQYN